MAPGTPSCNDSRFVTQAAPRDNIHSESAQASTAEDGASHTHTPALSPAAEHHDHAPAASFQPAAQQQQQADDPASAHGSAEPQPEATHKAAAVALETVPETATETSQQQHPRLRSEIRSGGISWQDFAQQQPGDLSGPMEGAVSRGRGLTSETSGWKRSELSRGTHTASHDEPRRDSLNRSRAEDGELPRDPARRSERDFRDNGREWGRDARDPHESRGGYERRTSAAEGAQRLAEGRSAEPRRAGEQHHTLDQARRVLQDRQPRHDRDRERGRLSPTHRRRDSRSRSRSPTQGGRPEEGGRRQAIGVQKAAEVQAHQGLLELRIQSDPRVQSSNARIQSDQAAAVAAAARRPGAGAAASLLRAAFKGVLETSASPAVAEANGSQTETGRAEAASQAQQQRGSVWDRLRTGPASGSLVQQEPPSRTSVFQRLQGG